MAGDLWECAVNSRPHELASLSGTLAPGEGRRLKEPAEPGALADDSTAKRGEGGKLMRVEFLADHGVDVSGMMGTIWRRERFNGFQSLKHIRDAYIQAFHADNADIRAAVLDPSLAQLAEVRNLLVHRAGKVVNDSGGAPPASRALPA